MDQKHSKLLDELGLVPEEAFAELFGITLNTCKAWRYRFTSPNYLTIGNRVFFRKEEIKTWLDNQSQASSFSDL